MKEIWKRGIQAEYKDKKKKSQILGEMSTSAHRTPAPAFSVFKHSDALYVSSCGECLGETALI